MTHRRSNEARKQPHQQRSRATIDAILIAATRVLEREGLAKLTTTRIAELAGVSVGSLYQYFPNREAIVGALIDQQLDAMLATFRRLVATHAESPLDVTVTGVLCGMLDVARAHERLHAPLFEEMSIAGRTQRHRHTLDAYVDVVAGVIAARREIVVADQHAAATLLVHATEGVIRALVERERDVHAVIREAVQMVCRYLAPAGMRSTSA